MSELLDRFRKYGLMGLDLVETTAVILSWVLVVVTFPVSLIWIARMAFEYERVVVFRMGRVRSAVKGPGRFIILPCIETMRKVDIRTVTFLVPPQHILTSDSVSVEVDAVVCYRITDVVKALVNVADYRDSTQLLAASTLRNTLGTHNLKQLLSERDAISEMIQTLLYKTVQNWGIEVESIALKDVKLPVDLQRTMAAEAEANRDAQAKITIAEGEIRASEALTEASQLLADNPMAVQLRYLQALTSLTSNKSEIIIFPFPLDVFKSMLH